MLFAADFCGVADDPPAAEEYAIGVEYDDDDDDDDEEEEGVEKEEEDDDGVFVKRDEKETEGFV